MRTILLVTTILASTAVSGLAQGITPGHGSLTDSTGTVWTITSNGSIMQGQTYTSGGGETSALMIENGIVFGEDSTGRGWFSLSGGGQYWTPGPAPGGMPLPVVGDPGVPQASPTLALCGVIPNGAATGAFSTANGQIYALDGKPFIARGINIMHFGGDPSAATLKNTFPGLNFVRLAIYNYDSPSALQGYVDDLTSHGIVVELENHNNGAGNAGGGQGSVFTGQQLTRESAWYASVAAAFKGNPAVWFGTNNEPPNDPGGVSTWQRETYQAIRGAGNANPIMVEINGWADPNSFGSGYTPWVYASMTNVIADVHFYGWLTKGSTDQATNNQFLASAIAVTQKALPTASGPMPVIIGEYGNSTDGVAVDGNGSQVVTAVAGSGVGSAAWAWGSGNPGDGLTNGGNSLSSYGQQVAGFVALTNGAPATVWANSCAAQLTAAPPDQPTAAPAAGLVTGNALVEQALAVAHGATIQ